MPAKANKCSRNRFFKGFPFLGSKNFRTKQVTKSVNLPNDSTFAISWLFENVFDFDHSWELCKG